MRTLLALAVTTLLPLGCGSSTDPLEPLSSSHSAILNGKTDNKHTAVVGVYLDAGNDSEFCSGFLIMPDLVVTARHCVVALVKPNAGCGGATQTTAGKPFAAEQLSVLTKTSPTSPVGLAVAEVSSPEDLTVCGNDIALLRLEAPLDGVVPFVPRIDGPPVAGELLTVVGYGASKGGIDMSSGTRRVLEGVVVQSVGAGTDTVEAEWVVSEGPCAGDSGSPALDEAGAAIGVMSRGNQATCKSMVYERLDTHAEWLRAAARASATRLGQPSPAWTDEAAGSGGAGGASGEGGSSGNPSSGSGGSAESGGGGVAGADPAGQSGTAGAAGSTAQPAPDAGPAADAVGGCSSNGHAPAGGGWVLLASLAAATRRQRR